MPLADARALQDPVIGGFHHLFEVGIAENSGRDVRTEGADLGAHRLAHASISPVRGMRTDYFAAARPQCPTLCLDLVIRVAHRNPRAFQSAAGLPADMYSDCTYNPLRVAGRMSL